MNKETNETKKIKNRGKVQLLAAPLSTLCPHVERISYLDCIIEFELG